MPSHAAPRVLTHDELAERVWRGRPVSPETMAQRVLLLRRALGDDAGDPRYLRVVRGVGCQLVPPVRVRRAAPAKTGAPRCVDVAAAQVEHAGHASGLDLSLPAQPSLVVLPFDMGLRMDMYGIITRQRHRLSPGAETMLGALRDVAASRYPQRR